MSNLEELEVRMGKQNEQLMEELRAKSDLLL
jgi:hypothetical protein